MLQELPSSYQQTLLSAFIFLMKLRTVHTQTLSIGYVKEPVSYLFLGNLPNQVKTGKN